MRIGLTSIVEPTGDLLEVEDVERKGLGHPDTLCDHLTEELGIALSRYYLSQFGKVLHHNVDKALLRGGQARPAFGGGQVLKAMELFLSGRAVTSVGGTEIPLRELAQEVGEGWLSAHLPFLDAREHVKLHCLVRPGSADLSDYCCRGDGPEFSLGYCQLRAPQAGKAVLVVISWERSDAEQAEGVRWQWSTSWKHV